MYDGTYVDVDDHDWFVNYVLWASKNGIARGKSDTIFDPNASITRQEMALMINNYITYKNIHVPDTGIWPEFVDEDAMASWAKSAVYDLLKLGVVNGKPNNLFDPRGNTTRGEAAKVIKLILELIIKN
jgi:hypothetical protein